MSKLLALQIPPSGVPPANSSVSNYIGIVSQPNTNNQTTYVNLAHIGNGAINILLYIAGIILVVSVITHSIALMSSGGNESTMTTAKKGLTNAVIGLLIVTLTFVIMNAIVALVAPISTP